MITPIKDSTKKSGCSTVLSGMLRPGSVVNSYCFYAGKLELDIASHNIFVNANTISKPVYTFWECLRRDPERLYEMIKETAPRFTKPEEFTILQDMWYTHESPYIVATMFFLLNRCSCDGLISSGQLDTENYTPLALSHLKKFQFPENFYLGWKKEDPIEAIQKSTEADYSLIPAGKFSYNLFEYGKNIAVEDTPLNHRILAKVMKTQTNKILAVYDYHDALRKVFKGCNVIMTDKHNRITNDHKSATEAIVANF